MNAIPACIPCYLRQALSAAMEVTDDPEKQRDILNKVAELLPELTTDKSPAENSTKVLLKVNELLNVSDPFYRKKKYYNQYALGLYPRLKELVNNSHNPLKKAINVSVAGNIIDLGILHSVDVEAEINNILNQSFSIDHTDSFIADLEKADTVLYNGDNSGEIVFDKILVEEIVRLGKKVYFAVKDKPILNDVTVEDAEDTGISEFAEVISNGSPMVGTVLETCSEEFRRIFYKTDLIISKGQGNFETLDIVNKNIYFILKAKCEEVAKELGVKLGDIVIKQSGQTTKNS